MDCWFGFYTHEYYLVQSWVLIVMNLRFKALKIICGYGVINLAIELKRHKVNDKQTHLTIESKTSHSFGLKSVFDKAFATITN